MFDVTLFALGLFLFWAAFITWVRFDWIDTRLLGGRWNRLKRGNSKVEELDPSGEENLAALPEAWSECSPSRRDSSCR